MRTALRLGTSVAVVWTMAVFWGLSARASAPAVTMTADVEAWYRPDPTCASSIGCAAPKGTVSPSPYPPGTLHVGWTGSAETARTYLVFPVGEVGDIAGVTLRVPLDVDPAHGSARPDVAQVRACLATGTVMRAEGEIGRPPATDCSVNAILRYVDAPSPHLVGVIDPLLVGLAAGSGVALLPVESSDPRMSWHVTFSAHDRPEEASTPPASLEVTLMESGGGKAPLVAPSVVEEHGSVDQGPLGGIEPLQPPAAIEPLVGAPLIATPSPTTVPGPVGASGRTYTFGYAYPGLWLLPLVALVLVPLVARSLTQNMEPRS